MPFDACINNGNTNATCNHIQQFVGSDIGHEIVSTFIDQLQILCFYAEMNHFQAHLIVSSRVLNSKVLRMAIQFKLKKCLGCLFNSGRYIVHVIKGDLG